MWLKVGLDQSSVIDTSYGMKYVSGENLMKHYFNDSIAEKLDEDKFLENMWNNFDAMFDWGDCDFFDSDKCLKLSEWLKIKLSSCHDFELREFYSLLLEYSIIAVEHKTGVYFDF
ncbi:MAG: hypothetical protein Q4B60_09020 [Erysipelotrichaceae bacterium]|nr:hypothetical protein [Erysipelotrichaceae bacterium]